MARSIAIRIRPMLHCSQILTPLQIARATIEAYPYMKDVFGIMEVVAAEVRILFNSATAGAPLEALPKCAIVVGSVYMWPSGASCISECMDSNCFPPCTSHVPMQQKCLHLNLPIVQSHCHPELKPAVMVSLEGA